MSRPLGPDHHDDEPSDLSELAHAELVVEAAETFGEEAAREMAERLGVPFEDWLPVICA